MRAVVQRVKRASVTVEGVAVGQIHAGLLVLLAVGKDDDESDAKYMADKTTGLRVFADSDGLMNRSLRDVAGSLLAVSQFTLFGDVRKGKRPSFTDAAAPETALRLYEAYCRAVEQAGVEVQQGVFQADMQVELLNDGPVTILLDSKKLF